MKKITLFLFMAVIGLMATVTSCSSDGDASGNPGPVNTGDLKLFVIDTAKVNTISMTGTNENTVLNKMLNLNSYIGAMAIAPDGTKFAYTEFQAAGTFPNMAYSREVRLANADGSGDISLYASTDVQLEIDEVKIGSDNKVYFITQNFAENTRKLNTVAMDGTGMTSVAINYDIEDVSPDGNLFTTPAFQSQSDMLLQIIDRNDDNGAGGLFHSELFAGMASNFSKGVFTNDGKSVVIAYKEGTDVKVRLIDLDTKTAQTKTLVSNFNEPFFNIFLSMASDSNRGVLTLGTYDSAPSKSYMFNLSAGTVAMPFLNNDPNVGRVYAH
ncbi:hypothetical protein HYN48_00945 [Flavobacterium magnum]|uniref:DUF4394 domain-containing protein n=1 Tax=Flavobacterium magnum TaxID=2162713 RepID=A0A2S0RBY2_9FLAO|nr:hypothetical protein [Flavobacterium magnum]AWA28770.1 hypothetical protein HYN48_00945 [Flavobacterium magnum]